MTRRAVRHLDNVVELNLGRHALAEQEEAARLGRRIGLGVTGLADALAAMGVKYDSEEALRVVDQIMAAKKDAEYRASIDLAMVRGAFPLFEADQHYERGFCAMLPEEIKQLGRERGQRHVAVSTVAPAGSLSVIAQCSSGIEPIFALNYKRYVELGTERKEFSIRHQGLARMAAVQGAETVPEHWVTAHDVDYRFRVAMQGIIQRHTDASISSTINLPRDATPETVGEIYMEAWRASLKGVTVYREGSREGILVTDEFAKLAGTAMDTIIYEARAEAGDKFYIPISYEERDVRRPYQVFLINYKTSENDRFVKIGNDLVRMLRDTGVDQKRIQKYLDRSNTQLSKLTRFLSLSMKTGHLMEAVGILEEHGTVGTLAAELYKILNKSLAVKATICRNPACGSSNVRMEEGCMHCLDCNWSGCG
jgi:ribonucleoside-diphosphate reductase alpha chain